MPSTPMKYFSVNIDYGEYKIFLTIAVVYVTIFYSVERFVQ